jgi:hypothetical protein
VNRASVLFLAGCLAVMGCRRTPAPSLGTGSSSAGGPSPAVALAPSAPARPPISLRGSNVALTSDEATLVVADEDHEALYLVPASLAKPAQTRVVPLPGPPGQVVVLGTRVLVTVRTLPTDAARKARDIIRGPLPTPATMLAGESAAASASAPVGAPSPASNASAAAVASSRSEAGRAKRAAALKHAKTRPRNTPPAVFDPALVRQSQGGLLLALAFDPAHGLREVARATLPPDAWGLAVTPDLRRAIVTSAWAAQVSLIELDPLRVVASVVTPREPRGIAITPDGKTAYVSHLTGSSLTELELGASALVPRELELPPAPARTPLGAKLEASLGYDLVLAPDAESLYLPRHAIGAEGVASWWGAPTVDVLDRASKKPVAPFPKAKLGARLTTEQVRESAEWEASPGQAPSPPFELVQPRAVVYRKTTDTLLIASEGTNQLTEVDALAADPSMAIVRAHELGAEYDVFGGFPDRGGAPSGIALTRDESAAFVYCRTTFDVVRVELGSGTQRFAHLADDGLPADASYGRRLFTDARHGALSGGLGCAACHPEGRDDGYVWREGNLGVGESASQHFAGRRENVKRRFSMAPPVARAALYPRQTPMLAGRVRANGPYGWHAESPDIVQRLLLGTGLHRAGWQPSGADRQAGEDMAKLDYLMDYLRSGLLPPPTLVRALDEREAKGKAIFESEQTTCSRCHVPGNEFTDRGALPLPPLPVRAGFDAEPNPAFKTPSLWFIAGSAPYFHDGSRATLEELIAKNNDRMGKTSHLTPDDQAALVAYLRTL